MLIHSAGIEALSGLERTLFVHFGKGRGRDTLTVPLPYSKLTQLLCLFASN